jgi:hypothetical protein
MQIDIVKAVLHAFDKAGLWDDGLELIGSWCFHMYQKHLGVKTPHPNRRCRFPHSAALPLPRDPSNHRRLPAELARVDQQKPAPRQRRNAGRQRPHRPAPGPPRRTGFPHRPGIAPAFRRQAGVGFGWPHPYVTQERVDLYMFDTSDVAKPARNPIISSAAGPYLCRTTLKVFVAPSPSATPR